MNRLTDHKVNTKQLRWFLDAGHGWLRVPIKDVIALGIERDITEYSYINDGYVYLEEDCDAILFASKTNLSFSDMNGLTITVSNCKGYSSIRNYPRYSLDRLVYYFNKMGV